MSAWLAYAMGLLTPAVGLVLYMFACDIWAARQGYGTYYGWDCPICNGIAYSATWPQPWARLARRALVWQARRSHFRFWLSDEGREAMPHIHAKHVAHITGRHS